MVHGLNSVVPRLWSAGSVAVVCGLSCSAAGGIFPNQGSNPGALHWQADSLPLSHQGSSQLLLSFFSFFFVVVIVLVFEVREFDSSNSVLPFQAVLLILGS